jgi:dTDP-4-amino-4,6-dideoxygalactose transaminase
MTESSRIFLSPPHMSAQSRELLLEAFDSNWVAPVGAHVDAFEKEFAGRIGASHAVALSSGTAALHIALRLIGLQPGDEVVTSSLTFAATANAITYLGGKPVFIDSDRATWNMDPELLAAELQECARRGKLPKAVVAVDIYGQCADYDRVEDICRSYGVPLVEDAAEALGATYKGKAAGLFGAFGCFSFNGNKIITTSAGGMLVCPDADLARRARYLASQACGPGPHYEHCEVGYNYRMSNLLAAVGRGQLAVLDERIRQRRANYEFYADALSHLPGISFMPEPTESFSTKWLTCILVDPCQFGGTREDIRLALERNNIESRPIWKPMHMQMAFSDCRMAGGAVSGYLFANGLCLPSGSNMSDRDRSRVAETVRSVHRAVHT